MGIRELAFAVGHPDVARVDKVVEVVDNDVDVDGVICHHIPMTIWAAKEVVTY